MTFAEIVDRLSQSRADDVAWKWFYSILYPTMFRISFRILRGNRDLAEDAVQESFIRIFQYTKFNQFVKNPDALRSYSLIVCRNVATRYVSQLLRDPVKADTAALVDAPAEYRLDPEIYALRSKTIQEVVLALTKDHRELLDLILDGYTTAEIAKHLSISYVNAAVRIHRLWAELAKVLK